MMVLPIVILRSLKAAVSKDAYRCPRALQSLTHSKDRGLARPYITGRSRQEQKGCSEASQTVFGRIARTCSSVANSPRAAAAFEAAAMADCSSGVSGTGGSSSVPVSRRTT